MKTNDFIRRVEKIGYKTEKTYSYIDIYDADNMIEPAASVNMYRESQLFIYHAYYELTKLIIEYAETPLAEREDDKKYYVKVFNNDFGYLNVNYVIGRAIASDREQDFGYQTQFTKSEIKQLKQRDDIPLDWDKVKLIEVDDESN